MNTCIVSVNGSELVYLYHSDHPVQIGQRVLVPLKHRSCIGITLALGVQTSLPKAKLRYVLEPLDGRPIIAERDLCLWRSFSLQYQVTLFYVMQLFLPKEVWNQSALLNYRCWYTTSEFDKKFSHLPVQSRFLCEHQRFMYKLNTRSIKMLARQQILLPQPHHHETRQVKLHRTIKKLNIDQRRAIAQVVFGEFNSFLLHGVTGSGKTTVYHELIAKIINQGNILVLLPEIRLVDRAYWEYKAMFPEAEIDIIHSGLNNEQILHSYFSTSATRRIVITTRLGVVCPISNLRLIIVDEEHDSSYKHNKGRFRYHARLLAMCRAWSLKIPVVLGSATPSLYILKQVQDKQATMLSLPCNAIAGSSRIVEIYDVSNEQKKYGISGSVQDKIKSTLLDNKQVLVFLNNVGYARELSCSHCNWKHNCSSCDNRMHVFYTPKARLECRWCKYTTNELETMCPVCNKEVMPKGLGTESLAKHLQRVCNPYKVLQIDAYDKQSQTNIATVISGEVCIAVGTQMIVTGHDFKHIGLVCIINLDNNPAYQHWQGQEYYLQLVYQAMGRTGRNGDLGEIIIQTSNPKQKLLRLLKTNNYIHCAEELLTQRQQQSLPPFWNLLYVYFSDINKDNLVKTLGMVFRTLQTYVHQRQVNCHIQSPLPCLHPKIATNHYFYLQMKAPDIKTLNILVAKMYQCQIPSTIRVEIDINPLNLH